MRKIASIIALGIAFLLLAAAFAKWKSDSAWLAITLKHQDAANKTLSDKHNERVNDYFQLHHLQSQLKTDELKLQTAQTMERIAKLDGKRPDYQATANMEARVDADREAIESADSDQELTEVLSAPVIVTDVRKSGEIERRRDRTLELVGCAAAFLISGLALASGKSS